MDDNNKDEKARKNGCPFCKRMFYLFCSKFRRNITIDEYSDYPYKPDWCNGQDYIDKFNE